MIFMDGCRIRLVLIQPGKSCDFQQDPQQEQSYQNAPKNKQRPGWFFTPSRCLVIPIILRHAVFGTPQVFCSDFISVLVLIHISFSR